MSFFILSTTLVITLYSILAIAAYVGVKAAEAGSCGTCREDGFMIWHGARVELGRPV